MWVINMALNTKYYEYEFKLCGGTWKYCNGLCSQCIYTQNTTTTNITEFIRSDKEYYSNTTGISSYDKELEVEPNGKTTYTY